MIAELVLFVAVQAAGLACLVYWLRSAPPIIPRQDPRFIFRIVRREDRAAYRRVMRRTYAVALRDLQRSMERVARTIAEKLTPAVERAAMALRDLLKP
jgi:hypothetical protein